MPLIKGFLLTKTPLLRHGDGRRVGHDGVLAGGEDPGQEDGSNTFYRTLEEHRTGEHWTGSKGTARPTDGGGCRGSASPFLAKGR
jgi:hypothetical protein